MKHFSKSLVCLLLVTLLAAAALIGCAQNETPSTEAPKTENQTQTTGANAPIVTATAPAQTPTEMGEGEKLFYLEVTFDDGVIQDRRTSLDEGLMLVGAGLLSKLTFLTDRKYGQGLTVKDALAELERIRRERLAEDRL